MAEPLALQSDRECVAYGARVGGTASANDLNLGGSVGTHCANRAADVIAVKKALNLVPISFGRPSPELNENAEVDAKLISAISDFQILHFGIKNGRIDVRSRTHAKLSSLQPAKVARVTLGKTYLDQARSCMLAAQTGIAAAKVEQQTGGSGILGKHNLDLVNKHFDIAKDKNPSQSLDNIGKIFDAMLTVFERPGGLWGWKAFESEPFTNPTYYAFCFMGGFRMPGQYGGWQRYDTVYLSAYFDRATPDNRIQTIVHELAHFVGPSGFDQISDFAYGQQTDKKMLALSPSQKQHNAENYGNYAFEAKFGRQPL